MTDNIGMRIKDTRKRRGLTQEELGIKIGVTKATINKYETGIVVNLKRPVIEKIAEALEVNPAYLMGWVDTLNDGSLHIGSIAENNGVIGQTNGSVTINNGSSHTRALTKEEIEILRIYNQLGVRDRMKLLSEAIKLEEATQTQDAE